MSAADTSDASTEELEEKLNAYKDSYRQIEAALKLDPTNEGLLTAREQLMEVINLTQEVIKGRRKVTLVEEDKNPPLLSPKEQLRRQQEKEKEERAPNKDEPLGPHGFKCGGTYQGLYTDGKWYEVVVLAWNDGTYTVEWVGYGETSELPPEQVREKQDKKRKSIKDIPITVGEDGEIEIPKSLKIMPEDSDEVRNQKRRRIHALKYAYRMNQLEESTNSRKNAWKEFNTQFSQKPKTGFLTGRKKESIFKSPDTVEGKVGVTGSGQAPTAQPVFKATEVTRSKKKLNL